MPTNSLYPAFFIFEYSSAYGAHKMTVPCIGIDEAGSTLAGEALVYTQAGLGATVQADNGAAAFVDVLKPFFPPTVVFTGWTLYKVASIGSTPTPFAAGALSIAGTNASAGWSKAVQFTWTWRCSDFSLFKIVMLDADSGNNFDRGASLPSGSAGAALDAYVRGTATWVQSRANGRPTSFLQIAKTLNEKLRRSYGMN